MRGEEILLPLRFGEGWGGVSRIYARGLLNRSQLSQTTNRDCALSDRSHFSVYLLCLFCIVSVYFL
jgi:hypothetical protein